MNTTPNEIVFTFVSDPGHGWLLVHPKTLKEVMGENMNKISQYSFKKMGWYCLEEDCDCPLFLDAIKEKGIQFGIAEISIEEDFRRDWWPPTKALESW